MSEGWQGEPGCAEVNRMFFGEQEVGQHSAVLGKEPVGGRVNLVPRAPLLILR